MIFVPIKKWPWWTVHHDRLLYVSFVEGPEGVNGNLFYAQGNGISSTETVISATENFYWESDFDKVIDVEAEI